MLDRLILFATDLSPLPGSSSPGGNANDHMIKVILTIVITVVGAVAVLFVAIGGFRYVMSQGDPQAVSKAKGTIAYAIVGMLLAISAQVIVTLVIGKF